MKIIISLLFALVLTAFTYGQKLPILGKISDLQSRKSVYLVAETNASKKKIQKVLEKNAALQIVEDAAQAEFILEYKQRVRNNYQGIYATAKYDYLSEISAYFYDYDMKKVIGWWKAINADALPIATASADHETYLAKEFLKAYTQVILRSGGGVFTVYSAPPVQPSINPDDSRMIYAGTINDKAVNLVQPAIRLSAGKPSELISVKVVLNEEGTVIAATGATTDVSLRLAVEAAAKASKFRQTIVSGEKVRVSGYIAYRLNSQ